jgi:glutaconate CoA-transferase subunit A
MPVVMEADAAVRCVADGAVVGLGGSVIAGHPMGLVRALIRSRRSGLTVAGLTSGLDADLLVASGSVATLAAAYVGAEDIAGLPPAVRWAAEEGRLAVWESEEGVHLASLRARAQGQPFATWTGALGTSVAARHPLVEQAVDERTGMHYLKVRPLKVDVALLWAEAADTEGNLLLWGAEFGDEALRNAADTRIVQVERVVATSALARHPERVVPWGADIVVRSPLSTHPFGGAGLRPDADWLRSYVDVVTKARATRAPDLLEAFLTEWIHDRRDEDAYLDHVGMRRLRELLG